MIKYKKHVIYGDFLDSYMYNGQLFLHTSDNRLWILRKKSSQITDAECEILLSEKEDRFIDLDQFLTDFDIYNNSIYYCNSDGVFQLKLEQIQKNNSNLSAVQKIWDANVVYLKAGSQGRIALSASDEGLYEFDTQKHFSTSELNRKIDSNLYQITKQHSSYCSWSLDNIWNGSYLGNGTFIEFAKDKDNKSLIQKKEYFEMEMFRSSTPSLFVSTSKVNQSIYYIQNNQIGISKYRQTPKGDTKFQGTFSIARNFTEQILDFKVLTITKDKTPENIYIYESSKCLICIDQNGNIIYKTKPNLEIVSWRVISNKRYHQIHIVFDDKLEIISFD